LERKKKCAARIKNLVNKHLEEKVGILNLNLVDTEEYWSREIQGGRQDVRSIYPASGK